MQAATNIIRCAGSKAPKLLINTFMYACMHACTHACMQWIGVSRRYQPHSLLPLLTNKANGSSLFAFTPYKRKYLRQQMAVQRECLHDGLRRASAHKP